MESYPIKPPVVSYEKEFILDAVALYERLTTYVVWDERLRARKTATFGTPYNYSGMTYEALPMHPLLLTVVDQLEMQLGYRSNNCLLNYYPDGESTMGFHSDSTDELVPSTGVAIISLGAERTLTFRSIRDRSVWLHYPLANGSLLYMPPEVQHEWQHAIRKQDGVTGRISLTFRCVRDVIDQ